MMRKVVYLVTLWVVSLGLGARILADEVKLRNGDRITGEIVKADSKTLTIKTDYAGSVPIAAEAIAQISSDQPLYFALSAGETVVGKLATRDDKYEVSTEDASLVSLEPDAVRAIRSKPEQDKYERLLRPSWLELWNGGLDFGYSLTTGNARSNTLSLGSSLNRQTSRDRTSLYANYINAKNNNDGVTETTANAIRGGGRYEIGITNRFSAFSFADFEYNEVQLLDLRAVFGGGLGNYLIKKERAEFQVFGGGSYNRENFSDGVTRNSGEILAGEELSLKLSDRVLLRERLQFFPNLTDRGEYRVTLDASLNTKLNSWLSWHITASNRYLSNPALGSKNNDLLLTTGIGVSLRDFSFR